MKKKNVTFGDVHLDDDKMTRCAVCERGGKISHLFKALKQPSCHQLIEKAFCSIKFIFSYTLAYAQHGCRLQRWVRLGQKGTSEFKSCNEPTACALRVKKIKIKKKREREEKFTID